MKTFLCTIIFTSCIFTACDFPADPPLLVAGKNPVSEVHTIDSARSLLPLSAGNRWNYLTVKQNGSPQNPHEIIATEVYHTGTRFFILRDPSIPKGQPTSFSNFPIVRSVEDGLIFYSPNSMTENGELFGMVRPLFKLPYPAKVGDIVTIDSTHDFSVFVAAKDTLIRTIPGEEGYRCYRYEIYSSNRSRYTLYALPGSAFIRIEYENLSFHAYGWRVN